MGEEYNWEGNIDIDNKYGLTKHINEWITLALAPCNFPF